jgi:hypothetical protein
LKIVGGRHSNCTHFGTGSAREIEIHTLIIKNRLVSWRAGTISHFNFYKHNKSIYTKGTFGSLGFTVLVDSWKV